MSDSRLEARNLCKTFGQTRAVDRVSLSVRAGEAFGLVGPDGAGKTTTMRLLVGALASEGGEVRIAGHDLSTQAETAREHVGYLAQRFSLYTDLTVYENLHFFGEVRGLVGPALARRAAELLQFVGLVGFEKRLAGQLSGGMKQKLGLASALIHRPQVLLLDEPTAGVDPVTRQDFWQLIIRLLGEGVAVVVSTPYMDEAVRCNRIGFMYGGRLLTQGTPRELTATLAGRILELVAQPKVVARQVCRADPDVENAIAFGDRLHLRVRDPDAVGARLPVALAGAGVHLTHLRPISPTIEDVFLALLEGAEVHHD
ncbi:MAG: ABC transporter ATP-binding protein [Ardenticatenaceae bacterium]|nr:ABC transporter ATP-binding protein [Ardenticatenaceae bacterium]